MHIKNSLNIFSYILIAVSMIVVIGLAAENISNYNNEADGNEKSEISMVLLTSSLFITVSFFSFFCIYVLSKAGKKSIYSIGDAIKNKFLILNSIIFAFSLLIFLPAIALAAEFKANNFTTVLIFGGILSLITSFINTIYMLRY